MLKLEFENSSAQHFWFYKLSKNFIAPISGLGWVGLTATSAADHMGSKKHCHLEHLKLDKCKLKNSLPPGKERGTRGQDNLERLLI